jgi:hypothetical protein
MGCVVNSTPRPLYPWGRPGTHCISGWMGPRAGMDGCSKSRPPPGFGKQIVPTYLNDFLNFFLPKYVSLTQRQKLLLFKSLLMQLWRMKTLNFYRTKKYSLERQCGCSWPVLWLILATVACYWSCLDRVVLAQSFWVLATCPVCCSVLGAWANGINLGNKWCSRINKKWHAQETTSTLRIDNTYRHTYINTYTHTYIRTYFLIYEYIRS